MGRPRFRPLRTTLTAIAIAGAIGFTIAAPCAAAPWQHTWGDYDRSQLWHDANWWLINQRAWVVVNHPEWTDNYAATRGQIGDYDRFHEWHYGDGALDRLNNGVAIKTEPDNASINGRES